ncbi:MAG: T9SS type A sorting domain-containing protein, partial [Bacteroidota bacterium]
CADTATLFAGYGFDEYVWSTGDTTQTINVFSSGMYYITATTYNGDTISDSINVILTQPYLNLNLGNDTLICGNDTVTLDAGIGFSQYLWNTGSVNQSINVNQTGTYNIVVSDTANCSYMDTINVVINPGQSLDIGNDTALCDYGLITLDAGIAFDSYQWSTGETTQIISVDSSGTYYITATNITCSVSVIDSVEIIFHAVPVADAGPDDTICSGNSITLSASGGLSYHWNTGANTQTINVTPQSTTTYTVTVTNSTGCTAFDNVTISVMTVSVTTTNATCGQSNGTATAIVTGGIGPYTYLWNTSPPQTTSTAVNLAPGSYSASVTDVTNNCTTVKTFTISNISGPVVSVTNIMNANCGMNNGSIAITVSGGLSPYTFLWNSTPPQTTQNINNIPPGNYCVTVTDGNGCTTTISGIVQSVAYPAPDICMVSVDTSSNQNLVIWEKPVSSGIDQYYIFRESSISGIYNLIGSQNYSDFSTFIDLTSNSLQQPYRYKLAIYDYCGLTSQQSSYHQTIHLTISAGMGGAWNLEWNNYEGFSFSTYNIYRGTNAGNMILLNSVAITVNSYTDLAPPTGIIYYMIEAVKLTPCNPSFKSEDSFGSTISNVANTNEVGINEFYDANDIQIFPNPANSEITVSSAFIVNSKLEILNSLGQIIYCGNLSATSKTIDVSGFSKGVYFLILKGNTFTTYKKIVLQ